MKKYSAVFSFCLCLLVGNARAEGGYCPPGYFPTSAPGAPVQGCAPIPGYNQQQAAPRQPHWANRYGAVAWDTEASGLNGIGISSNYSDPRKSEKAALKTCAKTGGSKKRCKIVYNFSNGCIAMAQGATGVRSPHVAKTAQAALDSALRACRSDTTDCKIIHGVCSPSVLVQ